MSLNPVQKLAMNKLILQEYNLFEQVGVDYWHSNILEENNFSIAGGFGETKDISRKIAYAEFLEKTAFRKIKNGSIEDRLNWGLNIIPTGCGFAAGFNLRNAILRSIGESLERWVMSKWIDEKLKINSLNKKHVLDKLDAASKWFYDQFDEVLFYEKEVAVQYGEIFYTFKIGFSLALKDDGIFPGSSAQTVNGNVWQHSLIESYRHYLAFKNTPSSGVFPDTKVRYFAKNKEIALKQVLNADIIEWPVPQICFHYSEFFKDDDFYLVRTIIKGWKSWNSGSVERFLY